MTPVCCHTSLCLASDDLDTPAGLTRVLRQRNRKLFAYPGVEYNPMFPDDSRAHADSDEEFDDEEERELEAAKMRILD